MSGRVVRGGLGEEGRGAGVEVASAGTVEGVQGLSAGVLELSDRCSGSPVPRASSSPLVQSEAPAASCLSPRKGTWVRLGCSTTPVSVTSTLASR